MTIKKYIRALPDCVADFVQAAATPATDTAASQVSKSSCQNRKRKGNNNKNYATTAAPLNVVPIQPSNQNRQAPVTNAPPAKCAYTHVHPQCPTCTYHHPAGVNCRFCANCNIYGHFTAHCCLGARQQAAQAILAPPAPLPAPQVNQVAPAPGVHARACYSCGDPNHFANVCPLRVVKQEPQQQPPQQ
ncbi:uncharacterized protein LOC118490500 [Helianthus annuus]|uniref:uncharacterized protein LOC118490500 n=1 Tax=Helianthus annuus TaxID=4232 RepID=UPI00165302E6|nr:uncharacterized protein LOC118490500 [Helianthus annuus]